MATGSTSAAEAGALCVGELTDNGDVTLIPLERAKIEPRRNACR